jgi:UDP-N-acetylglucosamine 2-epimerase (non-hydrolysing)
MTEGESFVSSTSPAQAPWRALPLHVRTRLEGHAGRLVHVIVIATKPDIIKQASLFPELTMRGELVIVCHTGQHYASNYSTEMLAKLGLPVDVHLGISGSLSAKVAQIVERFSSVIEELRGLGLTPIPYIHGDTMTSMATGVSSYLNQVACVHVEAGIQTLTPRRELVEGWLEAYRVGAFDWESFVAAQRDPLSYERGSREPFPEQFNTRVSDAGSGYHAASVGIIRDFLIDEGFPADTIEVVGNTVVDAAQAAQSDAQSVTIFEKYPQIKGGRFIRICVHRRENTEDKHRFLVLFEAMETLVRRGHQVLFIRLFGTDAAVERFALGERLAALERDYPVDPVAFISSQVWESYRDVVAAMRECAVVATDSGSMQEEMNILGVPCVTLRFGSDRA